MESVGDARSFLSAARESRAAQTDHRDQGGTHRGGIKGGQLAYRRADRQRRSVRCGPAPLRSLASDRISDLFHMAEVLGKQPRPRGPRLTILTNAGGPGVLATDALLATGGELASISDASLQALNQLLPPHWSHANPIDILGDADPERYSKALEIAVKDPNSDGLLVILAPQGMTDPAQVAEALKAHGKIHGKPVLASWMGGKAVAKGIAALNAAGIPTFSYPDTAVRAFTYMWNFSYNLRGLYETPSLTEDLESLGESQSQVKDVLAKVRAAGRTILTEAESKQVMVHYGIPTVETRVARSESDAVACAQTMGFPVVLKLHSETITHKSDVGGVKLNLQNAEAVCQAYRAIESSGPGKGRTRAFPRRHRAADGESRWIRADRRQQRGRPVRAGDSIRLRRTTCRGLW